MIIKKYIVILLLCLLIAGNTVGNLTPAAEDRMQFEEAAVLNFDHSVARKSFRKTITKKNELFLSAEDLTGVAKATADKYGRAQGLMPLETVSRPQGILCREAQILKKIFLKRGFIPSEARKLTRQLYPNRAARKRLTDHEKYTLLARQQAFHDCMRATINSGAIQSVRSRINEIGATVEALECELKELGGYKTPHQMLFGQTGNLVKKEKKLLGAISKVKLEYQEATRLPASKRSPKPGLSFTLKKETYCVPEMLDYNEIKKIKGTKTADNVINRRQQSIDTIVKMNAWINDNHRIFRQKVTDLQRELKPIQGALVDTRKEAESKWANSLATGLHLKIKALNENITSAKASVPAKCSHPNLGESAWQTQPWVTCQTYEHAARYNKIRNVDDMLCELGNYRLAHQIDYTTFTPADAGEGMRRINDNELISTSSLVPFGPLQENAVNGTIELLSSGPLVDLWTEAFRLMEADSFYKKFGKQPYRFGRITPKLEIDIANLFDF